MANFFAIHSLGESLVEYLWRAYEPVQEKYSDLLPTCTFSLLSSDEMSADTAPEPPAISLYLYRVTVNEHLRNVPRVTEPDKPPPLALDLHYLITAWADKADDEQRILGWVLHTLHSRQTLGSSDLTTEGGWSQGDTIQLIPAELSNEDLMRIWDALDRPYHLSVSYIARVVLIEATGDAGSPKRVVARRLSAGKREDEP